MKRSELKQMIREEIKTILSERLSDEELLKNAWETHKERAKDIADEINKNIKSGYIKKVTPDVIWDYIDTDNKYLPTYKRAKLNQAMYDYMKKKKMIKK